MENYPVPGSPPNPLSVPSTSSDRRLVLLLLAVVATAALLRPLAEPDEGRYGEAAREMLVQGDYLLPRQSGVVYPDKPPGVYWLMAGAMAVFGPTAFAVRLPAFLALLALVVLVHRRARDTLGEEGAAVAPLILMSCPLLLVLGQLATLDVVLSACVAVGLLAGRRLLLDGGWRPAATAGLALGAAFLVKGPVGPAVALAVLAATGAWEGRWRSLPRLLHPALWTGLLLVGAPWYLLAVRADPGLREFWVGREVVGRLASDVHERGQPAWYYPALVAGVALPWLLGLLSAERRREPAGDPAERRFHAVWAFLPVLLFSLPQGKQPAYYAPAVPGLALWLAAFWSGPGSRAPRRAIGAAWAALAVAGLLLHLDPVRARSEDRAAEALIQEGLIEAPGAQLMSWSYGLVFRTGRTDLECLGPPPKAWAYAAGRGEAPPVLSRRKAFDRAVELLRGPGPAFVLVHEPGGGSANLERLFELLALAGEDPASGTLEARPAGRESTLVMRPDGAARH